MFFTLLLLLMGIVVLIWIGCQRVAKHLRSHPAAMKAVIEHLLMPLLGETNVKEADRQDSFSLENER
ncbi:hypothetical protein DSM3645_27818 [Blastopirellula marina DSM 3645]|uniref:Uncharacterized protein n=2 Tax=Blastopirellula marina TaxID=124 RepID=A3ZWY2_9BACT|nr:hypothetical protein DSM3645_27818 [Blastopirellula marina DSM 3645]